MFALARNLWTALVKGELMLTEGLGRAVLPFNLPSATYPHRQVVSLLFANVDHFLPTLGRAI
jgi:hypothetical protein